MKSRQVLALWGKIWCWAELFQGLRGGLYLVMKCAFDRVALSLIIALAALCTNASVYAWAALEPVARPQAIEAPAPIRTKPEHIVSPKILRVVVDPDGTARFEGLGTPGSRITVEAGGAAFGPVTIRSQGRWGMEIARVLGPGEHVISARASGAGSEEPIAGHEIRISVPKIFIDGPVVAYDAGHTESAAAAASKRAAGVAPQDARNRGADLDDVTSKTFDKRFSRSDADLSPNATVHLKTAALAQTAPVDVPQAQPHGDGNAVMGWLKRSVATLQSSIVLAQANPSPDPVVPPVRREQPTATPAQPQAQPAPAQPAKPADKKPESQIQAKPSQPPANPDGVMGTVQDWLARANREYQGVIIKQLSSPPSGNDGPDLIAKKLEEDQKAEDAKKAAEAKRLDDQRKAAANAKLKAEEDRRQAEAAAAKAEEAKKAEESRKAEVPKQIPAEDAKKVEEAKKAETARKADEARRIEESRKAEDLKKSEAAKVQEKAQEETKRLEAAKAAEAQKLREADQRRADEERSKANDARRVENERRQAEAKAQEAKAQDDKRRVEEAEKSKNRSRTIVITPEPIAPRADDAPRDRSASGKSGVRAPDTRIAEGSAETGPVEGEPASWQRNRGHSAGQSNDVTRASWRARQHRHGHVCRASGRLVTPPAHYVVARGDSLWRISARHYRSGRHYMLIYRANRGKISDPDLIYPCQRVLVPRRRHH